MKTHWKKMQNPNYVGSWDLADQDGNYHDKVVTIKLAKKEMVFDGKGGQEECTVIELIECKPMVANSTNLRSIARYLGSNFIEDWEGQKIILTVQKVKAFGEMHDAIRVKKYTEQAKQKKPITQERFEKALESLRDGLATKEQIINNFSLTDEQLQAINQSAQSV